MDISNIIKLNDDTSFKEIDLTKGVGHEHPDFVVGKKYLIRCHNRWHIGYCDKVWYGFTFDFGSMNVQFDAPGYNNSHWQLCYEIIEEEIIEQPAKIAYYGEDNIDRFCDECGFVEDECRCR